MDFSVEQSIHNRITRIGIRDQRLAKTEISTNITTIHKNNKYNIFLFSRNLAKRNASIASLSNPTRVLLPHADCDPVQGVHQSDGHAQVGNFPVVEMCAQRLVVGIGGMAAGDPG